MNLIGQIDFVDSVVDFGDSPELAGPNDVISAVINGQTFVYVAANGDAGIQVLSLSDTGVLEPVTSIADTSAIGLDGLAELELIEFKNESFIVTTSFTDQMTMFRIDDDGDRTDGHLVPLDNYKNFPGTTEPDAAAGVLDYPEGLDVTSIGNKNFVLVGAYNSDTLSVYQVSAAGVLTRTDAVSDADDPDFLLNGTTEPYAYQIGNKTFVYVGGDVDAGINVFQLNSNGKLSFVEAVPGNAYPYQLVAMDFNGKNYLFATDDTQDSIEVYSIANNGKLTFVSETPRFINGDYSDIFNLQPLEIDGVPFLSMSSENEDTIAVLSLNADEELEVVRTFTDNVELDSVRDFAQVDMGDRSFILSTANFSSRVSVFELGGQDDPIVGTQDDDRMVGKRGDDDLIGRDGDDELIGGAGDDVLSGRKGKDDLSGGTGNDVLIGGAGNDTLDGGGGVDILIGGAGTDTAVFRAVSSGVTVSLSGTGASTAADSFFGIENVVGSRFSDQITGDNAKNLLRGGNGNDTIEGLAGVDNIQGGNGNDDLSGGDDNDKILGQNGKDTITGGDGRDNLNGGAGNDVISGGEANDRLTGGAGNDTMDGGAGKDTYTGGGGADVFIYNDGDGNDIITDFELANDTVDLSGVADLNSLADVRSASIELRGDVVVLLDGGASLTIQDVRLRQLSNDNFDFG